MSNTKKSDTLGMPHGTAQHRLRKNILFSLLQKYGEDACFKCGEKIETVDDLSVEHKLPWEGISAELFWDLKNIAFSHLKCNVPHIRYGGAGKKIIAPIGQSWCASCEKFKAVEEFTSDKTRWNGLNYECKLCKDTRNVLRDRTNGKWKSKNIVLDSSNDKTQVS